MVNKYINATYQEIYDIATTPNKVTIIGIRTPSGSVPSTMLAGLWKQFKSVKYNGMDFVMRASGVQPLDPLQVGTTAGSQMDMRDIQNPILFRGCHGESLGSILNDLMGAYSHGFSGDSLDIDSADLDASVENFYYQCLTDMSWQKSMPSNGFARNGLHPLVYGLASNYQLGTDNPDFELNDASFVQDSSGVSTADVNSEGTYNNSAGMGFQVKSDGTGFQNAGKRWFTNDLQPLGWLDTENRVGGNANDPYPNSHIPRCYMGVLLLPPSYTSGVRQYFRMVCTHYFTFKDFRSISLDSDYASTPGYYNTLNLSRDAEVTLTSARVR